jgi:hypothetical protein
LPPLNTLPLSNSREMEPAQLELERGIKGESMSTKYEEVTCDKNHIRAWREDPIL